MSFFFELLIFLCFKKVVFQGYSTNLEPSRAMEATNWDLLVWITLRRFAKNVVESYDPTLDRPSEESQNWYTI